MDKLEPSDRCLFCDGPISFEDRQNEHGVCYSCRTARRRITLARVSYLLCARGDLSTVEEWCRVRELAMRYFNNDYSDSVFVQKLLGFLSVENREPVQAGYVRSLAEIAVLLERAIKRKESRNLETNTKKKQETSTRKKPGRRARSEEEKERYLQLADDWNRARETGVSKAKFAGDHEYTVKRFDKVLDMVRKWKSRSDN